MATCRTLGKNGRFGNQLFQIAATYAQSLRMGEPMQLPEWEYAKYFPNFKADPIDKNIPYITWQEKDIPYSPIPEHQNLDLFGYFQSEKYFYDYRRKICELFYQDVNPITEKIAIHVRRGDYLNLKDIHINQSLDYYSRAMAVLGRGNNFIVFSDDIQWCKEQFLFMGMEFASGTEMEDFMLMRSCKGHIIANSSFSWWAAWLSHYNSFCLPYIIAPYHWLGRQYKNDMDIVPDNWILLK